MNTFLQINIFRIWCTKLFKSLKKKVCFLRIMKVKNQVKFLNPIWLGFGTHCASHICVYLCTLLYLLDISTGVMSWRGAWDFVDCRLLSSMLVDIDQFGSEKRILNLCYGLMKPTMDFYEKAPCSRNRSRHPKKSLQLHFGPYNDLLQIPGSMAKIRGHFGIFPPLYIKGVPFIYKGCPLYI